MDEHEALTNQNAKYALQLLSENENTFREYTYAEQFDKLTQNPSDYYGELISIAGYLMEITPLTEVFDANYNTTLYADGIRSILLINVEGLSNANNRSMLVFSTLTKEQLMLDGIYSISGLLAGTTMYKVTVHLQGQTETNFVKLPVLVADEELIFPLSYEEYFFGYLGAYDDEEFVQRMLEELYQ